MQYTKTHHARPILLCSQHLCDDILCNHLLLAIKVIFSNLLYKGWIIKSKSARAPFCGRLLLLALKCLAARKPSTYIRTRLLVSTFAVTVSADR